ncbi:MAG: hypothetical protein EOM83_12960, partial [Clostridia bacterium]|nr:hypothetical protein [Clostridia bacterium]
MADVFLRQHLSYFFIKINIAFATLQNIRKDHGFFGLLCVLIKEIQRNAQRLYDRPVRKYELPDGRRLLSISRDVLDRIYHWGLLYRLEGDRKWLDRAYQEMTAVAAFPDWNPSHYLDTAEMMHAFAIGYDWFYQGFSEEQRKLVREALWQHGLRLSYSSYMGLEAEGMQGWKGVENN